MSRVKSRVRHFCKTIAIIFDDLNEMSFKLSIGVDNLSFL